MKFYDKGFLTHYENYHHLQIYEVGSLALDLKVYPTKVCQSTLQCISSKEFNEKYLHHSYQEDFLYNLLSKNEIYHKDVKNQILIKVKQ